MSNSNVGPAGCTDHQATHCLLTQCDSLCTCPGERQRSLRCAFQSRRSRRGLRPSLHLWIVCATRNRLEHEHTRLYANVLEKRKEKVASSCDLAVGITELEQQKRRHWSGISVFLVTVVVLLHGFQQSLSVVWE